MDRRKFLQGVGASVAAAALPAPLPVYSAYLPPLGPVFGGAVGIYNGVVIREVFDLNACARRSLEVWADRHYWGAVASTVVEGVAGDGDA